jgi:regulator of protease activity HflC (stomatin/prohibitin superfamily)
LDVLFSKICLANIQFLQLRSVDLPNLFEEAIQESEVKKQDIKKADAELNKVKIEVDTRIKSAEFQKRVTINIAEGEGQAIIQQNQAETDSLTKTQNAQGDAYKKLKENLGLKNNELFNFLKSKLVKSYNGNNLVLNIATPEKTQK